MTAHGQAALRFVDRKNSGSLKWHRYAGQEVVPAWVADIDAAAAEPILAALHERVAHGVLGYSTATEKLAEVIVDYFYRRWRWQVSPEWLVYSPGLGACIHNVCRLAGDDGEVADILTPAPIYHVFRKAPAFAGQRRVDICMTHTADGWMLPDVRDYISPRTRVFQLCNPHNPNGKVYRRDELEALAECCLAHDLIICADEVHADLILDTDAEHIPIASLSPEIARRTITMQSPSKAFNVAGLNFAVVVIPDAELRRRYRLATAGKVLSELNPFGYAAAMAAWSGACDSWRTALIAQLRQNRDRLAAAVTGLTGITMPPLAATYLAWLNIKALALADPPAHFVRHGIGMSPGADFGDGDYMRLNFGCSPELLEEMITRLRQAVESVPGNCG